MTERATPYISAMVKERKITNAKIITGIIADLYPKAIP